MKRFSAGWLLALVATIYFGCVTSAAAAPDIETPATGHPEDAQFKLNFHVFGLSYHPDRKGTRVSHLDNELNIGLGLNYQLHSDARGIAGLEGGFFRDSGRKWAKFAGTSYLFKLNERWAAGADVLAIHSPTYNRGKAFVAPIPRVTYDFGPVKLNAVFVPRLDPVNRFAVFGFYITVPLGKW